MGELSFSPQTNVGRRLVRVKGFSHRMLYEELSREALGYIKGCLERRMLGVQRELLECESYERTGSRRGYRHGFQERSWTTRLGKIEGLRVPRIRGRGSVISAVIERYQRREAAVDEVLLESFVHGLSTRDASRVLEKLNGITVSATTLSRLFKEMDFEVRVYRASPIGDRYKYLVLDGVELKVFLGGVEKRQVLCALGVGEDDRVELLGFLLAASESEQSWVELLSDLQRRGLRGDGLKLITADGASGIWAALQQVYPGVLGQSCCFHKIYNATGCLRQRRHRRRFSRTAAWVYQAPSAEGAYRRLRELASRWRAAEPEAVRNFQDGFERTVSFYAVPQSDWRKVRTTNILERFFEEVRRRLRTMRVLPNIPSLERNFYAQAALYNAKRTEGHPVRPTQSTQTC